MPRLLAAVLIVFLAGCQAPPTATSAPPAAELAFFRKDARLNQTPHLYYAGISDGLAGPALKAALHDLIDDHTEYPYTDPNYWDCWDALKELDAAPKLRESDPDYVLTLYSRERILASEMGRSNAKNHQWNREHVWSTSRGSFKEKLPAYTDLHHLRAADKTVNSARGNRSFAPGGRIVIDDDGNGVNTPIDARSGVSEHTFEPPPDVRGDIARMVFYMSVRYEGDVPGDKGEPDLEVWDYAVNHRDTRARMGKLSVLLAWHEQDGVSDEERARNEGVYRWQGNRNPFIDRPHYVGLIWGE